MWGYGSGWGMMDGWGGGFAPFHGIFWLLVLVLVITCIVWLVRSPSRGGEYPTHAMRRSPGLDVLEERYARGEIGRDEYLQKKRDITG